MRPMHILLLAQFYPPLIGGEERHVRNLAQALAARGHAVSVATIGQQGLAAFEHDGAVKVHRLQGTMQRLSALFSDRGRRYAPPFPDPELTLGLRRIVAAENIDVVHAHNWLLHSYLPLKRPGGPGLVVTLHDLSLVCVQKNMMRGGELCAGPSLGKCLRCATDHYGPVKGLVTLAGNRASGALERSTVDKFLAVSRAIATGNRLAESDLPFEVVPNFVADDPGVVPADGHPQLDLLPADGFLLYVGDLRRLKGLHVLLEAYAMLRNAPPLVLIGRRCEDTPRELLRNVMLFESWPHAAVMQAWRRCLFGLTPSILPEACASVIIEAMTVGKPVVATTVGGSPDLIDDGQTGLLVPPRDAQALYRAMRALIEHPDLCRQMGAAARIKAREFTASAIVPRIEQIYADVAEGNRRVRNARPELVAS
ncbi:glycosyltransferase family 4 protein [Microbacteriaceae bacterium K1510]|nr:glycosyltransferase family 4 protein [Microbacteriaceae bacterium K1510]